jgi:hypothetical protein
LHGESSPPSDVEKRQIPGAGAVPTDGSPRGITGPTVKPDSGSGRETCGLEPKSHKGSDAGGSGDGRKEPPDLPALHLTPGSAGGETHKGASPLSHDRPATSAPSMGDFPLRVGQSHST